jgi:hypothetical protein
MTAMDSHADVSRGVLAAGLVVAFACVVGLLVTHFLGL